MMKHMILLCILFSSNACAQPKLSVNNTSNETLYPYRYKSGKFGYVNDSLQTRIEPQYTHAELFTEHGFAVITDSLDRKGVIDKNNKVIITTDYDAIQLHALNDFTLAQVLKTYYTRWRFWEWEFLPGFSFMGAGGDGRLFDTKVKRVKKTVFILGDKSRKVRSKRLTPAYINKYFDIKTLDSNQVLIDDRLYEIRAKSAHFITSAIKDPLPQQTFSQQKDRRLHIIDRKGKRVKGKAYLAVDSIHLKVEDKRAMIPRARNGKGTIASVYQNVEGQYFIYPDFSKPLPQIIHKNKYADDPTAEELIRGLWLLASVPDSDYFLCMSYREGQRFIRFLDTRGKWHQTLPPDIPFTIVRPSGDILWPAQKHYIPQSQVPEGWKIDRISQLNDSSMYHISLSQDKTMRQGIWNAERKQWLIRPEYYEVYPMSNTQQWRYHSEYGGLWGILDYEGNILIKPTYSTLRADGWVTQWESGKSISFYLHPLTLNEFREKQ